MGSRQTVPPLRTDLVISPRDDGRDGVVIFDEVLGRRLRLDGRGAEVVAALDAPQSLSAFVERVGGEAEALGRVVQALVARDLLDTAETAQRVADTTALRAVVAAPEAAALLVRPGAAFTCTMCGSCCGGHNIGPVADDTLAGLDPLLPALEERAPSPKGHLVALPDGQGGQRVMCHTSRGSCVFLAPDGLCTVHMDYGPEHKPRVCRLFPYTFTATPRGIAVSVSAECRGADGGRPLGEQVAALRELVALVPRLATVPVDVPLAPGHAVPWGRYEEVEAQALEAVQGASDDLEAIGEICGVVAGAVRGPLGVTPPPPLPREELGARVDELHAAMAATGASLRELVGQGGEGLTVHVEAMDALLAALGAGRADWARVLRPLPALSHAGAADLWPTARRRLSDRLWEKELLEGPTVVDSAARLAWSWLTARQLLVDRARAAKRRHVVHQDVLDATVLTTFLLRNEGFTPLLDHHQEALTELYFWRLPELLDGGPALASPDLGVDIFRF